MNTLTSGFSNPAEDYVTERLTIEENVIQNPLSTFFFTYRGRDIFNIKFDDILAVDRSIEPEAEDLVVATNDKFNIIKYKDIQDHEYWGKIIWVGKRK